MLKKVLSMLGAVAVAAGLLSGVSLVTTATESQALSGSQFDPGNIISDQVFFNSSAMSEAQIQSFLAGQIGSCTNSNCLNVKRLDTASRGADAMCGAYQGASQESVARIIFKVSQACGINPQVLLVTLQKEQGLISGATARGPSDARLERAMGYACPDSANGGCDPTFAGVYNQVYKASWQFKRYANPAGTSNYFSQYAPGGTRTVLYNPNAACGSRSVFIANQATANLYYYTPYTPNAAALANLSGTGDACSAYGNRNFWVYFNNWFGSTTGDRGPVGFLDALASPEAGLVSLKGWTLDPDDVQSLSVHVYVDGTPRKVLKADGSRPDVAAQYPKWGAAHGFDGSIELSGGRHSVCAYAINVGAGSNSLLGGTCSTVDVVTPDPVGSLDSAAGQKGGIALRGWSADYNSPQATAVHVYVDGRFAQAVTASGSRPDVGRAFPGLGSTRGYESVVTAAAGQHDVCAYGINQGRGTNALLGSCVRVVVPSGDPVGSFDSATATSPGAVELRGWALDPDDPAPLAVHVYVDGSPASVLRADRTRPDVERVYPASGSAHGFSGTLTGLRPGPRNVCVYAINVGPGSNALVGGRCATVTVR